MGQSEYCIDGDFLPPIYDRLRRAFTAGMEGHADDPYKDYRDPDVREHSTTTLEGLTYNFSVCDPNPPSRKPIGGDVLYILGGLRSMAFDKKHLYDRAKSLGIPVVFGQLPNADDFQSTDELLPRIDMMSRHFLNNLPMMERYQGRKAFLFGTSTGGYEITDYLHSDADKAAELIRTFHCVKLFSAFYKAAFASGPISKSIYPPHARMHHDKKYNEPKLDKDHTVIKELMGDPVYINPENNGYPTHAEIMYMANAIHARREKLLASPFPRVVRKAAQHGIIEFLHGDKDGVACKDAAKEMADHMGADFVRMLNTFHNIYTEERIEAVLAHFASPIKKPYQPKTSKVKRVKGCDGKLITSPWWGASIRNRPGAHP